MAIILTVLFGIGLISLIIQLLKYWIKPSEPRGHKGILEANDEFVEKMREIEKKYDKKNG